MLIKLILCLGMFIISGCCATTDPTKGGLFCYNSRAYEKRLEERRQEIAKQEITRQALAQESRTLQNEVEAQRTLRDQEKESVHTLRYELAQLEAEIVRMQNETERYKARTAEQLQRKQRMSREIQAIRERISELKASASQVAESKKKELRRQIEVLGRKLVLHLSPE